MKIHQSILVAIFVCLGLFSGWTVADPVGKVLVAVGQISVSRAGQMVSLATGSALENGDVVHSADNSNAQLRMLDGTIMSIRPNSSLSIDSYHFDKAESKSSRAVFSLLKGGLRTITGLIGKTQPESYRVGTPTSTIGIRGTHYALRHCAGDCTNPDGGKARDGTFGRVFDGVIFVENNAGSRDFGRDEVFFVADRHTGAERLISAPALLGDRPTGRARVLAVTGTDQADSEILAQSGMTADGRVSEPVAAAPELSFVAPQSLNASGGSSALSSSSGSNGMATAWAYAVGTSTNTSANTSDAAIAAGTALASLLSVGDTTSGGGGASRNGASLLDTGSSAAAGNVSWGRWASPAIGYSPGTVNPPGGVHLAMGDATPSSAIPNSGASVIFSHVGGTNPTNATASVGTWQSGSLSIDFVTQTMATATAFAWTTGSAGSASYSNVTFSGVAVNTGALVNVTPTTGLCSGGFCSTGVSMAGVSGALTLNSTYAGASAQGLILSITSKIGGEYSASVQVFQR